MKNRGFSFIELIIALALMAIIISGLAYAFFIPLSASRPLEYKLLAYNYAQREMESIVNSPFNNNFTWARQTYSPDNKFSFEILETSAGTNMKNITIRFFDNQNQAQISELFSTIRNRIFSRLETFDDGSYNAPTYEWTNTPGGQWDIVSFGGSSASRYRHHNDGTSYITGGFSPPSANYSVSARVYLSRSDNNSATMRAAVGLRSTTGGVGYHILFEVDPAANETRVRLITGTALAGSHLLSTTNPGNPSNPGTFFFNQWVTLRIEAVGSTISYFFNGALLGTTSDTAYTTAGIPFLTAINGAHDRFIYYDDVEVIFY